MLLLRVGVRRVNQLQILAKVIVWYHLFMHQITAFQ